ncbi:uncharacterized protein LOC110862231 [Folsomia candida]|nr:uncharacterized protein LOC110862231 [Folsomia candida]
MRWFGALFFYLIILVTMCPAEENMRRTRIVINRTYPGSTGDRLNLGAGTDRFQRVHHGLARSRRSIFSKVAKEVKNGVNKVENAGRKIEKVVNKIGKIIVVKSTRRTNDLKKLGGLRQLTTSRLHIKS